VLLVLFLRLDALSTSLSNMKSPIWLDVVADVVVVEESGSGVKGSTTMCSVPLISARQKGHPPPPSESFKGGKNLLSSIILDLKTENFGSFLYQTNSLCSHAQLNVKMLKILQHKKYYMSCNNIKIWIVKVIISFLYLPSDETRRA
jgi:hypothetical protein